MNLDTGGNFRLRSPLIMSDFVRASSVDLDEAYRCGVEAVKLAGKGETGVMVRSSGEFQIIHIKLNSVK